MSSLDHDEGTQGEEKQALHKDEPRRHPIYMALLALTALAIVPLPFINPEPTFWLGLPLWLYWSFGWTIALSCLTAWGILRYWKDDELE